MKIDCSIETANEPMAGHQLARLLARLILDAEAGAERPGCGDAGSAGRNKEIPSTQEVSS